MKAYVVDAFTCDGQGGNPAGVVLVNEVLPKERMQAIAARLGFSETAFVVFSGTSRHKIRFFTPENEVALCGHATIASYFLLFHLGQIQAGPFVMETLAGEQAVSVDTTGSVGMTQNLPVFGSTLRGSDVAPALGMAPELIGGPTGLPIQIASTGLNKIFVPVVSLEALHEIKPDFERIARISEANDSIGMYCYCLETIRGSTAHCRNFAPVVGIREDSATGTSAAALGCVLHHYGIIDPGLTERLVFEQGFCIQQPSEIHVLLKITEGAITRVEIAGRASLREVCLVP